MHACVCVQKCACLQCKCVCTCVCVSVRVRARARCGGAVREVGTGLELGRAFAYSRLVTIITKLSVVS